MPNSVSKSTTRRRTRSKYNAIPTEVDGIRFASKKEAARYVFLKGMVTAGKITELELQPPYELYVQDQKICRYIADFRYKNAEGGEVVEDVKGFITSTFRLKQKLMRAIHNIEIAIV